jgi:hypothetical protein
MVVEIECSIATTIFFLFAKITQTDISRIQQRLTAVGLVMMIIITLRVRPL